jgi:starch synthase
MVSALAAELHRQGHDVRAVMPRYYAVDPRGLAWAGGPLGVPLGSGEEWCAVYRGQLPDAPVPVYFLDHERLYGRDGIYGNRHEPDFRDNPLRFAMLCRGAFQLCRMLGWIPDVLHAHDWPGALIPAYLETVESGGAFAATAGVLTIHNLGYQGIYATGQFAASGIGWEDFARLGFDGGGNLNLLQGGLATADLITTVSPTYAQEIQTAAMGFGLDHLLRRRSRDLFGVLNGMDYAAWNPENDPLIPAHFSATDLAGKAVVKEALQREAGLTVDANVPVIGMVTRLVEQKGVEELCDPHQGLAAICGDMLVQVVLLGTGEPRCETYLAALSGRLPNLQVALAFDNRLAHLIEGGSDFFLMPSSYEPCGLNQMYSLAYGTVPVVHATGGLADTVIEVAAREQGGTGFRFHRYEAGDFKQATYRALSAYQDPARWERLVQNGMSLDNSWAHAAREYLDIYRQAAGQRRAGG